MGQAYKIKYNYRTGNSFGSENLQDELDMSWEDLDVAKSNLKRIQEHYIQYQELNEYKFYKKRTNQEILKSNQNKDWFVKREKHAVFGEKGDDDYDVVDKKRYEANKEAGKKVGMVLDQDAAEFSIILKADNGNDWQIHAPWCGYFESLNSAEIVVDNSDMKIEF